MKTMTKTLISLSIVAAAALTTTSAVAGKKSWNYSNNIDEMTEKETHYAMGIKVPATKAMRFPYRDSNSYIGYGCDNTGSEWVFINFNKLPSHQNSTSSTKTHKWYETQIKVNGVIKDIVYTKERNGQEFIHISSGVRDEFITDLLSAKDMLIKYELYNSGDTYFRYDLTGSTAAITKARTACGISKGSK